MTMERDPNISRIIKESGLERAPDQLTGKVMASIGVETAKTTYKPLIGKTGRVIVILFILGIVLLTLLYSEPGGRFMELSGRVANIQWEIPQLALNFDFMADIKASTWLISTLVALLLLVLSDSMLSRRKRMV